MLATTYFPRIFFTALIIAGFFSFFSFAFSESVNWKEYDFKISSDSGKCKGQKFVGHSKKFDVWIGAQQCGSSSEYKLYMSKTEKGTYYQIADDKGRGQDHCELVNPSFTLSDETAINSGSCKNCSLGTTIDIGQGETVFLRSKFGEKFKQVTPSTFKDFLSSINKDATSYVDFIKTYKTVSSYKCDISIPPRNCTLSGITVLHNASHTFYNKSSVPAGQSCDSFAQTRTCTDGTLSGNAAYSFPACTVAPTIPAPTCTGSSSPTNPVIGKSLTVNWSSTNATSRTYSIYTSDNKLVGGPFTITPSGTQTYQAFKELPVGSYVRKDTVTGPGGSATCEQSFTVQEIVIPSNCSLNGVMTGSPNYSYPECVVEKAGSGETIRDTGYVYIKTTFEEPSDSINRFSKYWNTVNCSTEPHEKNTLGTISRKGACTLETENRNTFVRFTVYPFDVRGISDDNRDYGKGGGESAPRGTLENSYGYRLEQGASPNPTGWDLGGRKYLIDGNTIRYSWKFRIKDLSLLDDLPKHGEGLSGVWATTSLSRAAIIGQFHARRNYTDPSTNKTYSCGSYFENTHSPGLAVNVQGDNVSFNLILKLRESLIPSYLQPFKKACKLQDDKNSGNQETVCSLTIWTKRIPKQDVVGEWFTVEFDMKLSQKNTGSIAFSFGRKDLPVTHVAGFQKQKLLDKLSKDVVDRIPTKSNGCPNTPRIGMYALQYNPLYYADFQNKYTGPREYLEEPKIIRQGKPRDWIANAFKKTFLSGNSDSLEFTPKFIIDYDDFSIIQLSAGTTSSGGSPLKNLANTFTAFSGFILGIADTLGLFAAPEW